MLPVKIDDYKGPNWEVKHNDNNVIQFLKSIQNTDIASNCNNPCIAIPAKKIEEGLPVSMELMALTGEDKKLIAIAKSVEKYII